MEDNMDSNLIYTRKEMEERLPDYIFGKLDEAEKNIFEKSLPEYPDLIIEISDVRQVFTKLEKIDFNKIAEVETRNLNERILSRLRIQDRNKPTYNYARSNVLRYLIPSIAAMLLIAFATQFLVLNNSKVQTQENAQVIEQLFDKQSPKVLELSAKEETALDKFVSESNLPILEESSLPMWSSSEEFSEVIDGVYNEFISSFLNELNSNQIEKVINTISYGNNDMLDLQNINEENLQNILNEVENAEFGS